VWWAGWDSNPGPPPRQNSSNQEFVKRLGQVLRKNINEEFVNRELKVYRSYLEILGRQKKTISDRIIYLRRFLRSGLPLTSEGLIAFISSLKGDARIHAVKALRIYLRLKGRKDLLEIIKTPKRIEHETYAATLSEVREVASAIQWLPAKVFFVLLAESGLRPGEIYSAKIDEIDLSIRISNLNIAGLDPENRVISSIKNISSKRAFCSFYSSKNLVKDYIEDFKITIGRQLFRNIRKIRAEIYKAMDKTLGRRFELYALRRFWTTEMYRRGMRGLTIDMLQGRKPKLYRIMLDSYLKLTLKDLRNEYDKAKLII